MKAQALGTLSREDGDEEADRCACSWGQGWGVSCGWGGAGDAVGEAGKGFLRGTFEGDPPLPDLDLGCLTTTVPSLYSARGGGFVCFTAGDTEA